MSPVTVTKMSPSGAASSIGMTRKPSITASMALSGSTSVTMTCAPIPRARCASPRPHQPYPAITKAAPARSAFVDLRMPSIVLWPVPYRLSNMCLVFASFTAITATLSAPSLAIALRRITPVVVSSMLPRSAADEIGPLAVDRGHEVRAVVQRDRRVRRERRSDVSVVAVVVLSPHGVDGDVVIDRQMSGDVVLRRERVRGAERHAGSPGLERRHKVRRLRRDVEAGPDDLPLERTLTGEPVRDAAKHRHAAAPPTRFCPGLPWRAIRLRCRVA